MICRSEISGPVSESKGNGLWAEFDVNDRLTHIAYYKHGRVVPGCWKIEVDFEANTARAIREFEVDYSIDDPRCEAWLRGVVAQVVEYKPGGNLCSFCQKQAENTASLVTGPGVNICDICVELSLEILIEADLFSRGRMLSLLLKRRGTNKAVLAKATLVK